MRRSGAGRQGVGDGDGALVGAMVGGPSKVNDNRRTGDDGGGGWCGCVGMIGIAPWPVDCSSACMGSSLDDDERLKEACPVGCCCC